MNRKDAMQWCLDNLPEWPADGLIPDTSPDGWYWRKKRVFNLYVSYLHKESDFGQFIIAKHFYDSRELERFRPAELTFDQMINQIKTA